MVAASEILTRVRKQLIDERTVQRWDDAELLMWLSDGQRTIVAISPSLGEVTSSLQLAVGTKQTLPEEAFQLIDIKRNMGTDGLTPGRAVRVVSRELMDSMDSNWHAGARNAVTYNYIYDPQQPRVFYVWPPSTGENYLEVSRAEAPAEITSAAEEITVPSIYQTALMDYVMFRAHQKDTDYSAGNEKAAVYLQLFMAAVGGHEGAKLAESPNMQLAPTDLASKGAGK